MDARLVTQRDSLHRKREAQARKVLVLGDDTRSFLAIVRSLGRRGITVHAAPANFRSPALRSRYIAAIHDVPPWMGDGREWISAITALLQEQSYELVIPCNETTLLPLQRHRALLSRFARLAMPDDRAIATLFDKHETRELARHQGVSVAAGRLIGSDDTAKSIFAELGAPVVVKPRRSYSLEHLAERGKATVVGDVAQLEGLLREAGPGERIIEQFFPGRGVGVSVLASRGRLLQAFEHHRVREIEGASFYRRSAPLTLDLVQACEAICAALEYTGIAMFEFKLNSAGRWILLEVNARPWGSMPLPLALGVDFPYRWYRLLTAGEESPSVPYRAGVYGRNLLPELRNSLIEAEARGLGRMATARLIIGRAAELFRVLAGSEVHDVLVRDDLRPAAIEVLEPIEAICRRTRRIVPGSTARRRRRARRQLDALGRRAGRPRIIFVCQGNICRSPFAEALLRARLGDEVVEIGSAGMMPSSGRPTPLLGIEAAARYGVDLSAHRSTWLTRRLAESASLLIVFDEINRAAVLDRYPDLKAPIVLLGDLAGLGDIADPVNGGAAEFEKIYGRIATGIGELVAGLGGRGSRS